MYLSVKRVNEVLFLTNKQQTNLIFTLYIPQSSHVTMSARHLPYSSPKEGTNSIRLTVIKTERKFREDGMKLLTLSIATATDDSISIVLIQGWM